MLFGSADEVREQLNELGKQGWEAIGIETVFNNNVYVWLKRSVGWCDG